MEQPDITTLGGVPRKNGNDSTHLLDSVFSSIKQLGEDNELLRIFPNGLESINVEITTAKDERPGLRLTIKGATATIAKKTDPEQEAEDDEASISFNAEGHRIVAQIAMKDLEQNQPEIMAKVQQILDDGDRTALEAAIFPDVIRNSQPQTKPFHFVDIPFEDGGPANPPLPDGPHVLTKIDEFTTELQSGNGTAEEKVDALSWLFHLFGDVHQPLHCIERRSTLHPNGDRGGNLFKLKGKAKNLHSAWDSSVNVLNPGKDEEVLALEIMEEHSRDDLDNDLSITDTEKWARSSFRLAKRHAYSLKENPNNPPKPSAIYLKNMEAIGRKQVALAGYRLADRLQQIFQ